MKYVNVRAECCVHTAPRYVCVLPGDVFQLQLCGNNSCSVAQPQCQSSVSSAVIFDGLVGLVCFTVTIHSIVFFHFRQHFSDLTGRGPSPLSESAGSNRVQI